jgi:hypothetical protein
MKIGAIIILSLLFNVGLHAQSKLEKAKSDLKGSSSNGYSSDFSYSDSDAGGSFISGFFIDFLAFATYGALLGDMQPRNFYPYPFADDNIGEYDHIDNNPSGNRSKFVMSNTMAFQSGTFSNDFRANYRFIPILGLEVNHLHFFNRLEEESELGISSAMLNYYRIRERSVTGYWGIGVTYVGNDVNTTGFSYNLGIDVFIAKPVSLGIFWKQSFINDSSINEFRALTRYHIRKAAIHGGFIQYKIGEEKFPSASIGLEYRF